MRCPRCGHDRTPEQFVSAAGRATQSCGVCRERSRLTNRRRRDGLGADGRRADNLRQKYGLTPAEYDALRTAQDYRCAVCRVHESDLKVVAVGRPRADGSPATEAFRLVVDHCHTAGQVRGLLRAACNALIGHARDSPEVLHAAADYVSRFQTAPPSRRAALTRLRILDSQQPGRPAQTVRFRGAVTVLIDGYEIHIPEGAARTVVSPTGIFELL
ncbi:endonuclease VII domain-containing protein [Paractinoplanes lichenicola]|uniref:Endonuclease VII domain-containing protein n=1 Tax=Paractinoplanes lichenicola TaxID=2802976 RepID=A0ABS1VTL5_9ACTN|nr:endonuclease VII domain-containing protein [Actinoplanes lichenicola]MBL7257806.1 endonuclease VII domain-containing protein [Actinoplanes lichenicola]